MYRRAILRCKSWPFRRGEEGGHALCLLCEEGRPSALFTSRTIPFGCYLMTVVAQAFAKAALQCIFVQFLQGMCPSPYIRHSICRGITSNCAITATTLGSSHSLGLTRRDNSCTRISAFPSALLCRPLGSRKAESRIEGYDKGTVQIFWQVCRVSVSGIL